MSCNDGCRDSRVCTSRWRFHVSNRVAILIRYLIDNIIPTAAARSKAMRRGLFYKNNVIPQDLFVLDIWIIGGTENRCCGILIVLQIHILCMFICLNLYEKPSPLYFHKAYDLPIWLRV